MPGRHAGLPYNFALKRGSYFLSISLLEKPLPLEGAFLFFAGSSCFSRVFIKLLMNYLSL